MSQPHRSYQRPAPPPLYPLRGEGNPATDQPKDWSPKQPGNNGGGKGRLKWALIGAGVFLAAILLAVLTMGANNDNQSVSQNPYKPQDPAKPSGSFTQNYRLTETQGRKAITVQQVKVSGLNSKNARIRYLVSYSPTLTWPSSPASYQLKSGGNYYTPRVKDERLGAQRRAQVTFTIKTEQVMRGARLILEPQSKDPLQIGLEVPRRQRDQVQERSGLGSVS